MKQRIAIFDIDNCIADDAHRIHLINRGAPNPHEMFHDYHEAAHLDTFHNGDIIDAYRDAHIHFVTARPVAYYDKTRSWLDKHGFKQHPVVMRPEGDYSRAPALKAQIVRTMLSHGCRIVAAFDDRQDVIAAYHALGINAARLFINDYKEYIR